MSFKKGYILICLFLLALIVRLVFVLQSKVIPSSDAAVYDSLGLSISQCRGYVNTDGSLHSFYPPFYPIFLSIIYALFGHSYLAVRIIQSMIGAFTCTLIYLIGKKVYNAMSGALAAFVSIVYLPFIKSTELLMTELIFTFILSLIVFYLIKIQEDMCYRYCIILGILLGIGALTKSAMLLFPLFIIPVFIYSKKVNVDMFKKYSVVLLFFVLLLIPWVIRNYNIYHKFVPVGTQGGITFYSSYVPPDGIFGQLATSDDPVVNEADKISSPALRSNFLFKKTMDFIMNNPKKVLLLEVKKILYLWAPFDWEIVGDRWFNLVYVVMLPFFAFGLFLSFREFRRFYPILLPIIYFQMITLIFYGSPRFRLSIEPYIFLLSAVGILKLWQWIYTRALERRF